MKIDVRKKDIEKMFDNGEYERIERLLYLAYSPTAARGVIDFFKSHIDLKSSDSFKNYLVTAVMKAVRGHNVQSDITEFDPYIEKRKILKKKAIAHLTKEEKKHLKLFSSEEKIYKKQIKGKVSKDAYETLKSIYEYDKDNSYTLIHRTGFEVDPIFESGIRFGSSTDLYDMCQRMDNFNFMLSEISLCNDYKYSSGCFIVKIPKKAINEKSEPIFYNKDENIYLNPKYVVAYAPVRGKMILSVELNDEFNIVQSEYYNEEPVILSNDTPNYKM